MKSKLMKNTVPSRRKSPQRWGSARRPRCRCSCSFHTRSGAPLGLNLGIGAADAERARLLMLHAISPKPAIVLANGTFVPWAHGVPRLVRGDNGSIFRTDELVLPLTDLNIMVWHTPPYCPWLKGVIENFNHLVKWWMKRHPHAKFTFVESRRQRLLEADDRQALAA